MNKFEEVSILGLKISVTNLNDVVDFIYKNINELKGKYICVTNVHTCVMSYDEEEYKKIQNSAELRLPDGKPLSSYQKRKGYKNAKRVTGPDLMEKLFIDANESLQHYFYGSSEETLMKLQNKLKKNYPNLKIVGMYSPPFRNLTKEENQKIVENINKSKANILWVGLGAPKQEKWMFEHKDKINALMIGVGAGFDYHAGNIKRAPTWMQKFSLEWLYRLMQDPKRLFKRYFKTNFKYIWHVYIRGGK